jgi:hypothetical protein
VAVPRSQKKKKKLMISDQKTTMRGRTEERAILAGQYLQGGLALIKTKKSHSENTRHPMSGK